MAPPMPVVYSATFVYLPIVKRLDCFEVAVHVSRFVLLVTFCARLLSLSLKDQLIGRWLSKKLLEICTLTSGVWNRSPADRRPPLARNETSSRAFFFPAIPARHQQCCSHFRGYVHGTKKSQHVDGRLTAMFRKRLLSLSLSLCVASSRGRSMTDGLPPGGFWGRSSVDLAFVVIRGVHTCTEGFAWTGLCRVVGIVRVVYAYWGACRFVWRMYI